MAIPGENVEIVRRNHDAWSRGDLDGWLDLWAPDGVLDWSNSRGLDAGVYRGHGEIRRYVEGFLDVFEGLHSEIDDPVEIEEGVVLVENVSYFRGRDGIEVKARSGWLFALRDSAIATLTLYQTKQDALEAAGL